ncbi:MAG TPA: electron transfer flavoprotein subunit beta [Syntrophobacteraceae bacterium]|nr:electron transfer flavoprotein subunit beta [Syntrophobacteraceae bacterium]
MYHSIVLVKQVPDTANITGNVMQEDGTVNRAKLPAIFNPEDRVALEMALRVKDRFGGKITAITMGPPRASDILRECLFMGADQAILISDRKFAGADTLATSYVLAEAVKKLGSYDFIFAGRQAIDGDTAQVGPQTAEKLHLPQITYLEEIQNIEAGTVTARRKIEGGFEVVRCTLPVLVTVIKDVVEPRPFSAKRVMSYKGAKSLMEIEKMAEGNSLLYVDQLVHEFETRELFIKTMTMDDLKLDANRCGVAGSPTKVFKVESVVLSSGGQEMIEPTKAGLGRLIDKLMEDHILG